MTYIIAEIGSNFKNLNDCCNAITASKECGANAAKFQMATSEELYGRPGLIDDSLFIRRGWLATLKEHCDKVGIDFMCTAFSIQGYAFVNNYVDRHKVASCEALDRSMLAALKHYNKTIYVSLGAVNIEEAKDIKRVLGDLMVPMYCVTQYPAECVDLSVIEFLEDRLKCAVGYSDHTVDYGTIPVEACYSAIALEKHFNPLGLTSPDSPHSIGSREFKIMVDRIRGTSRPELIPTLEAYRHRRKVIAIQPIVKGEFITELNSGVYRTASTATDLQTHPWHYDKLLGTLAKRDYSPGDIL